MKRTTAFFLLFLTFFMPSPAASAGESIRIGAIVMLTGNGAQYGHWATNGFAIAADEVNASPGGPRIEILLEDSQGSPAAGVSAFEKLRTADKVQFVITHVSSVALAIKPLAERASIVQIDFASTTPLYSSRADYSFRVGPQATNFGGETASFLNSRFALPSVGAFYIENEFGLGMLNVLKSRFKGKIEFEEAFPQDGSDFRAQVLKAKTFAPRDIWFVGHLKESGVLVKQIREMGIEARLFTDTYSVEGSDFMAGAGDAAEGIIFTALAYDPSSSASPFNEAYRARFKEEPSAIAAQAYDSVKTYAEAMKRCSTVSAACVKEQLMKLDFQGVTGRIRFDENGDVEKPVMLKTIKNGKFVTYNG